MKLPSYAIGNLDYCQACGDYTGSPIRFFPHKCKPIWECMDEEFSDSWDEIRAIDEEDAAIVYAELHDNEGPTERTVKVKSKDGTVMSFDITYDFSIDYNATPSEIE